jgi:ATP-dependent DNA helicase RecG
VSSKNPSLPTLVADVVGQLAAASESEELEFKATTGQREEAAKALCGMLNGRGGRVIFGVDPKGNVVGQQVADKTLEQLAETFGRIQPDVNPHIETIALGNDRTVIITSVAAGQLKPYLYRGSAYRRVGPTTIKMTWDEQQKLLLEQVHRSQRWELERSPLSISDIDLDLLNTTITDGIANRRIDSSFPVGRTPQQLLLGLGLLRDGELTTPPPYCSVKPLFWNWNICSA